MDYKKLVESLEERLWTDSGSQSFSACEYRLRIEFLIAKLLMTHGNENNQRIYGTVTMNMVHAENEFDSMHSLHHAGKIPIKSRRRFFSYTQKLLEMEDYIESNCGNYWTD